MRRIIFLVSMTLVALVGLSQPVYMTRSGQVSFFSATPMENIEAINNEVSSMLNAETGEIVFAILIKSFHFEKALMEEHFNENYMESDRLPKSTFQGRITNLTSIDFKQEGSYPVTVEGDLTIHGVKQHITSSGTVTVGTGKISINASFPVKLADYKVERPSLVADKIAESIDVRVRCQYDPKS